MDVTSQGHFIVCGLGSLGQHCVKALKEFGSEFKVVAIAAKQSSTQEIADLELRLDQLIIGDCCQDTVLLAAGIERCRAVLIVTGDERTNTEAALAIRKLSPHTRLVIRSGKHNFNQLLRQYLGNFIAFEPTELPALALAWTALGDENLAWFSLDGQWLRVVQKECSHDFSRPLWDFNRRNRLLLQHHHSKIPQETFYGWQPDARVTQGDRLIYLETASQFFGAQQESQIRSPYPKNWQQYWAEWRSLSWQKFWQLSLRQKLRSIAFLSGVVVIVLLVVGTMLFHYHYTDTSWLAAFYGTAILLLGGYGDLFASWEKIPQLPWWLQLFALSLSILGTIFVGILYALLTEALLSASFQFKPIQLPVPEKDHIVLIGLDKVGCQIAHLLQQSRQPLVAIALNQNWEDSFDQKIPVLTDPLNIALNQAHIDTAKSLILATEDEMLNLEAALLVRDRNPTARLILRASGQRLTDHLASILPDAHVLSVYALMAEAFAGAAFGENILSLFRLNNQTILVTEYYIVENDTLNGLVLSDIAYGYGVVPILHNHAHSPASLMPSEDITIRVGDRLVVLASIEGLRHVELGQRYPKLFRLEIQKLGYQDAAFEAANAIARISGCSLETARKTVGNLPQILPTRLYRYSAQRLVYTLQKLQVSTALLTD